MRTLRVLGWVVTFLAVFVFIVWAWYLNAKGRPDPHVSAALAVSVLVFVLIQPPTLAAPADGTAVRRTRWSAWSGRLLVVAAWLGTAALYAWFVYVLAQELRRSFNPTLAGITVALEVLLLLGVIGYTMAGFNPDWSDYLGWRGLRTLVNAAIATVLAGYAVAIAHLISGLGKGIPRSIYRFLDHRWHVPWLNVVLTGLACLVLSALVATVVNILKMLFNAVLGSGNPVNDTVDDAASGVYDNLGIAVSGDHDPWGPDFPHDW